jgi:hypothetical protein
MHKHKTEDGKNANESNVPPLPHFNFFGIVVERKTDVLAATAFLLSVAGITYQLLGFIRGPDVVVFPTTQLLIMPFTYSSANTNEYVRFAADFAYVNKGDAGYNAIIKSEKIRYTLGTNVYEQQWQSFESYTSTNNGVLISTSSSIVQFQTVNGGSCVSHETLFAPKSVVIDNGSAVSYDNFLTWDEFIAQLSQTKEFQFELVSELFETKKPVVKKMKLFVTEALLENLKSKKWSAAACSEY